MTADSKNVIAFAPPKPKPAPALTFAEFLLDGDGLCGLELVLADENGSIVAVLTYALADCTPGFDLDRLRAKFGNSELDRHG